MDKYLFMYLISGSLYTFWSRILDALISLHGIQRYIYKTTFKYISLIS